MKMPRILFTAVILMFITAAGFSQVDEYELLQDLPPVVFINYEGPHAVVNTREEIRQIGVGLGRQIAEGEGRLAPSLAAMSIEQRRAYSYRLEAGTFNRYFIIHSVSGDENGKFNADIMGLGVDTGVDHIRNLRVIIQGYLQSAYNYNERDAALLAEYITVYNAVYRGDWDYFLNHYKTPVLGHLTRERTGLSIRYDEWPGRTLLVIPLGHGGLSSIDTGVIADRNVIEELRREDDMGIPQRQQLVDLMEREAEQAEQQVQVERQEIAQEERQIAEERTQIAEERQQIQEERQQAQIQQPPAPQQTEQELERREEAVQQREQELERREEEVDQRREEAQRLEEFAEQRRDEAQQQRQEIAQDQQSTIIEEASGGVYGITIERANPPMGRIVTINPATGREIRRSPVNSIHIRTITLIGGRILAIAGERTGSGAVRLVELNQNNLEMVRQGDDDIMTGSLLWVEGNDLYAITVDLSTNNCYLARFNTNLVLQAKSEITVHPEASVTVQQGRLLTQRADGSTLMLNPADLTEIR